ncbi:MAG TPA: hypothetical protein EYP19_00050 [Desulfobacterales bacterium]|nr:hypothetical protein [Desulfobacterales bacterium]
MTEEGQETQEIQETQESLEQLQEVKSQEFGNESLVRLLEKVSKREAEKLTAAHLALETATEKLRELVDNLTKTTGQQSSILTEIEKLKREIHEAAARQKSQFETTEVQTTKRKWRRPNWL